MEPLTQPLIMEEQKFYYSRLRIVSMFFVAAIIVPVACYFDYLIILLFKSGLSGSGAVTNWPLLLMVSLFLLVVAITITYLPFALWSYARTQFKDTDPQLIIGSQGIISKEYGSFAWSDISNISFQVSLATAKGGVSFSLLFSVAGVEYRIPLNWLKNPGRVRNAINMFAPQAISNPVRSSMSLSGWIFAVFTFFVVISVFFTYLK
jgi:hypothetical protein